MKNAVKYMLAALLALLIFYGGAGVNMMSYCCGDCRSAGVEVVLGDKCCEIHNHDHHHNQMECHDHHHADPTDNCMEHFCETDCCGLERINFEWNNQQEPVQKMEPVVIDLFASCLPVSFILSELELSNTFTVEDHNPPPIICPRVYLSLLTTLLI